MSRATSICPPLLFEALAERQLCYPPATPMWVAGGVDRERWYGHRFKPGQVVECAIRDGEGHAQGTIILEIVAALSTDDQGHWVTAKYLGASDTHMRWWMSEGEGKKLAAKCAYHFCEESSHDCKVTRRGASIHVEKFRVLTQKEINNRVPAWAFEKTGSKTFMEFLKKKGMEPKEKDPKAALPWVDPGEEDSEEEEEGFSGEAPVKEGLKAKLVKARDEVKRLERELSGKKEVTKGTSSKEKKEKAKRKKKLDPEVKAKKKRPKEKGSPSSGGGRKKRKEAEADAEKAKEARVAKKKKKAVEESSSYSGDEEEGLFGEGVEEKGTAVSKKGRRDRGPFGGGDIVRYHGESSSESEAVFRDAPAVPKASNQLKLMQYAKRTPGRLASRLLLKMQVEGAQGAVGANPADRGELTPPSAVHYFHTMIVPRLGQRLGMRAHREMRTLCTALGEEASSPRGRCPRLAPEGHREELSRRPLAGSAVPRAAGPRLRRPAGERRGGVHEPGAPPGSQAEGVQRPASRQRRKRKSREGRPERHRERKRQRRRQREGEEGLEADEPLGEPAQPPVSMRTGGLKGFLAVERSPVELFGGLWRFLEGKKTPLSRLVQLGSGQGAPPEDKSSKSVRGDELLPINPQAALAYLHPSGELRAQGVAGMVSALNYLAQSQGQGGWSMPEFKKELTQGQKLTVDHLRRALDYVEERKMKCGRFEETVKHLSTVRFDYQGEPVVAMEEIRADKVIAAWPKVGQAAVQDALTFLPEKLKAKLLDPTSCLKPGHEWPSEPHQSRVRASDEEWSKVVKAAYERG